MQTILLITHIIISISLIAVILMQRSNSDGLSGLSSGSGSNMGIISGRAAANILTKITYILAILFMANSLVLANIANKSAKRNIVEKIIENETNIPQIPVAK